MYQNSLRSQVKQKGIYISGVKDRKQILYSICTCLNFEVYD